MLMAVVDHSFTCGGKAALPALTDDLLDQLKAHKPAIVATLAHPGLPALSTELAARLSPEDPADIAAGGIHAKTLQAHALSFANGIPPGRIVVQGGTMTMSMADTPEPKRRFERFLLAYPRVP